MERIIYFDYCALIILIILLISTVFRKMIRGRVNRCYLLMIAVSFITVLADIYTVHLDLLGDGNIAAKYISHTVYLLFHNLTPYIYILYLVAQTDTWHKFKRMYLRNAVLVLSFFIIVVALFINLFYPVIFYFDEKCAYTRGNYFLLLYASVVVACIAGIIYIIHYRKLFSKRRFSALISLYPLMGAAVLVQFFYPTLVVEMFAITCGLLFILMMVQRPEEIIDSETGLGKLGAYVSDMKRAFVNEKPIKVIMINVANYHTIMEMLGYDNMNEVLRMIADMLTGLNKRQKIGADLYYLGVGKFRFVVDEDHFDKTEDTAQAIHALMMRGLWFNRMDINLMTYVCIADCPGDIDDVDSLLAFGNDLNNQVFTGEIYYAKDIYKKEYYDLQKDMDRIIEEALASHRFSVYYQPIYSIKEKRFNSAEALLRLKDDRYGFISPEVFIPAAEKSGAIHKIGTYVLEEVCRFISGEDYKELKIDYIEINLSAAQCMRGDIAEQVLEILDKYKIHPGQINLEITETAASYSQKVMMKNLNKLNSAGIGLSLDDFGTGYSNMRRIASLPFNIVKLDKSFVNEEKNPRLLIVLENTINMIKSMNMKIVVEGIETESLVKQFSDLQCEYIQGYYYSRPLPKEEFIAFIKSKNSVS